VDNIKMDLREVGWDGIDWIDLFQDRDQWRADDESDSLFNPEAKVEINFVTVSIYSYYIS
jgi:hypothetical protein